MPWPGGQRARQGATADTRRPEQPSWWADIRSRHRWKSGLRAHCSRSVAFSTSGIRGACSVSRVVSQATHPLGRCWGLRTAPGKALEALRGRQRAASRPGAEATVDPLGSNPRWVSSSRRAATAAGLHGAGPYSGSQSRASCRLTTVAVHGSAVRTLQFCFQRLRRLLDF